MSSSPQVLIAEDVCFLQDARSEALADIYLIIATSSDPKRTCR
jgi:hypothetical protein